MNSELTGIVNGHKVNDHLYRGGDVSAEGVKTLQALGVVQVICLLNRKQDSLAQIETERVQVESVGIAFANVPMDSSGVFSYDDAVKVPRILTLIEQTTGPLLVHCHEGKDRSSVICACYRITKGWTVDKAIEEGQKYGWHWYNRAMRQAVKDFAKKLNIGESK